MDGKRREDLPAARCLYCDEELQHGATHCPLCLRAAEVASDAVNNSDVYEIPDADVRFAAFRLGSASTAASR
jgi:hypothetical protein